jgi:regulatory protein
MTGSGGEVEPVKALALRILGRRGFSAREMEKRLADKGVSEEAAVETVKWLEDIGLIDDAQYAASIARHYYAKGYGERRVKDELFRRCIGRELWDEALSEPGDNEDAALGFLQKKLRGSRGKDDLKRANDALLRRGFSYDDARGAINRYLQNAEEIEE